MREFVVPARSIAVDIRRDRARLPNFGYVDIAGDGGASEAGDVDGGEIVEQAAAQPERERGQYLVGVGVVDDR